MTFMKKTDVGDKTVRLVFISGFINRLRNKFEAKRN